MSNLAEKKKKIIDKIRKLLRLAHSSNEHEAAAAAAKAQELLSEYNLSLDSMITEECASEMIASRAYKKTRRRLETWAMPWLLAFPMRLTANTIMTLMSGRLSSLAANRIRLFAVGLTVTFIKRCYRWPRHTCAVPRAVCALQGQKRLRDPHTCSGL